MVLTSVRLGKGNVNNSPLIQASGCDSNLRLFDRQTDALTILPQRHTYYKSIYLLTYSLSQRYRATLCVM